MKRLKITVHIENGEKLFEVYDPVTNLTVNCDEESLLMTLNMFGIE